MRELLKNRTNIETNNEYGITALRMAARCGNDVAVKLLLK
jgi:ankyrin repeat protein